MTDRFDSILLSLLFVWVPVAFFYRAADGATLPKDILALLVAAYFIVRVFQEGTALLRLPLVRVLLLFSLWMVGDAWVVGLSKWEVLQGSVHILILLGTLLAVLYACARGVSYEKQIYLALWVGAVLSVYGLVQGLGLDRVHWSDHFDRRAFASFGNPDYFAGYLAALFPLAFLATMKARGRTGWLFYRMVMILLLAALLFTKVFGAFLALGAAMLVLLGFLFSKWGREIFRENRNFVIAVYVFLVIGFGAYLVSYGGLSAFLSKEKSFQQRWDTYQVAMEMVKDKPWTGIGLGQLGIQFPQYQAKPFMNADPGLHPFTYTEHVHNEFLQFWVEGGIPGLALFLAVLFVFGATVVKYFKMLDAWGREWMMGILAGLTALLVQSLSNFPLQVAPTAVLFSFYLAAPLALGLQVKGRDLGVTGPGTKSRTSPVPLALGLQVKGRDLGVTGHWSFLSLTPIQPKQVAPLEDSPQGPGTKSQTSPVPLAQKVVLVSVLLTVGGFMARQVAAAIALRDTVGEASLAGHVEYAIHYGQRLIGLEPFESKAWKNYGMALGAAGHEDEAFQAYQKSIDLDPYDVEAMDEMAGLRMRQNRCEEAIGLVDKALAITPNYPDLFRKKGESLFRLKRYEEAAREFQSLSLYQPGNADIFFNLGVCSILIGHKAEAVGFWKKAHSLDPNDSQVVQYLKAQGIQIP